MHVHVGVDDPELAIATANRMRVHLPLLLALSANSPFWLGATAAWPRPGRRSSETFPRTGIPRAFDGYADYVDTLETLIDSGAFPEPTFVWWDLRLRPVFGTLEIRIMDTQAELWRTAALAALAQSLVRHGGARAAGPGGAGRGAGAARGEPLSRRPRRRARRAARPARAARDPRVAALAELAVEACRPHARELGCELELDRSPTLVDEPADTSQRELAGARATISPGLVERAQPSASAAAAARSRRSTARAQRRPSAIAVTISDWPTRASPAA